MGEAGRSRGGEAWRDGALPPTPSRGAREGEQEQESESESSRSVIRLWVCIGSLL